MERRYVNIKLEKATREEILNLQFRRLKELLERAYHTNSFYRDLYRKHNVTPDDINSLGDFRRKIPYITKKDLLKDQDQFPPYGSRLGIPKNEVALSSLTSGTSGIGQEVHPASSFDVEASSTGFIWQCRWAGLDPFDRLFIMNLIGLPLGGLWILRGAEKYLLQHFQVGPDDSLKRLKLMKRFSPHCFIAVPAYLNRLSFLAEENGYDSKRDFPDLKVILTATEAYTLSWLHKMEAFWGTRIFEWYGSTQAAGSHMFSCENGVYDHNDHRCILHNLEHRVLVEVLDRNTGDPVRSGEEGEIYVTVLFRQAFPSIRFKTEDRAKFMDYNECDCGRPFAGIEAGTIARYDDMIKMKAVNVWPEAVDAIIFSISDIEEYNGKVWIDEKGREQVSVMVEFKTKCSLSLVERTALLEKISGEIRDNIGVSMLLKEVAYGSLPHFEYKPRRWTDDRHKSI